MGLVVALLVGYIVGGVTFVPLLAWTLWAWGTRNVSCNETSSTTPQRDEEDDAAFNNWGAGLGEGLLRELKAKHIPDAASGYFAICREYVPGGIHGKPPERASPALGVLAAAVESPSVYQSMYRSIFDRSKMTAPTINAINGKNKKTRNVFYVVLRLGHLMLYDDSEQLEVRHVISLTHYFVSVYAGGEDIPEGELWIKRNCICLAPRDQVSVMGDPRSFYLFSDNCSEKEDFYHAMLRSQENHAGLSLAPPPPLKFESADLIKLVQQLHASEENLHTRWINALVGRLFLAMYKTKSVENFILTKVTKKIARVQKPSLISSINVQKLYVGDSPPFFTNPKLKELTVDGDLTVEADVSYKGNFRIDISALARIELGTRFKPREVTFILATILKGLEGHVLLRIKPPPSNRMWVTFEAPPKLELCLEPIVSSRQITFGVILRAIENRIRETVNETLVFPNWDDIPFSSTHLHQFRGGMWKDETDVLDEPYERSFAEASKTLDGLHLEAVPGARALYSSSTDTTRDTPALGVQSLSKRKALSREMANNTGEVSPTTDQPCGTSPRSPGPNFSPENYSEEVAGTVSIKPATGQEAGQQEQVNADASMRITRTVSPPLSPPPPSISHRLQAPHEWRSVSVSDRDAMADTASQCFEDDLASVPTGRKVPRNMDDRTSIDEMRGPSSSLSLERRSTLNQSLNLATTTAKKWLAPRQNSHSGEAVADLAASGGEGRKVSADVKGQQSPNISNGRQMGPIGRGQPLPPPGTPLPLPPKPDKRSTWTAQTASALANLARRSPLTTKTSVFPPTSPRVLNDNSHAEDLDSNSTRSEARLLLDDATQALPASFPKRRQRASVPGSVQYRSPEEQLLVVEAPSQDYTAPSSPQTDNHLELPEVHQDDGFGCLDQKDQQGPH